ncbi:PD-(D/E)XK motif protein [Micromonospora sp. WMMD980]|uniref:PD-(D/E)XK motif protein n=1 Tax=Micromonospora sp. WMMD980 TaxID=3016088 RepID=UPI0024163E27|nr:PD-(D/E)XK motif protein [Micromonospora sp. WMMD980]MDG4803566.1 PD-(D/E)XK motif protein [Micromonospora sp. WMMD980]
MTDADEQRLSDPEALEILWRSLPTPTGLQLEAQRVADWPGGPVLAAVDATGRRHLLIPLPASTGFRAPRQSRGLYAEVRRLRVHRTDEDENYWVDLSCPEPALQRLFTSFAQEVVNALSASSSADPAAITDTAERWRKFWSVPAEGLGVGAQLGLIGELWLLTRWLPSLTRYAVRSWQGPLGGRHDFTSTRLSVEVKTSGSSTGPTVHRIGSLDQLATPVSGVLYLMSLRLTADPLGEITLDDLIREARTSVRHDDLLADDFDKRLASAGWTPADLGRYDGSWRLLHQSLYEVGEGFPRLTSATFPTGLPTGITDVGYTLDTTACRDWLVADDPRATTALSALASVR